MNKKNLYIKAKTNQELENAETNRWKQILHVDTFIKDIETPNADKEDVSHSLDVLITGVPNPWARAKLTTYALVNDPTQNEKDQILSLCYSSLEAEWRGLFAAYTLYPDSFSLSEPIELNAQNENNGEFEILSMYSTMLFEDTKVWKHQKDGNPMIQLLFFEDQVVGATTPYTIFFVSTNYRINSKKIPWIKNGKFIEPLEYLNIEEKNKLCSYISVIIRNLADKYKPALKEICEGNDEVPKYITNCLLNEFTSWNQMFAEKNAEIKKDIPMTRKDSIIPQGPLATLLKTNNAYFWTGTSFAINSSEGSTKIEKPSELLLDSPYLAAWRAECDEEKNKFRNSAVYYVEAPDENTEASWFCTLPLSDKATFLINDDLPFMLSSESESLVHFLAEHKDGGRVQIAINAYINDDWVEIVSREYTIEVLDCQKKAFIWPDFYSEKWKNYYFYSEYPHNNNGTKLFLYTKKGYVDLKNVDETSSENADETSSKLLVSYPKEKVASDMHRYEIVRTSEPLQYLEIKETKQEQDVSLGFLIIKREHGGYDGNCIKSRKDDDLRDVTVGIDFGSTNSCLYYKADKDDPEPIKFKNRRVALIGFDNETKKLANPDELLFITNEESTNGQIKSWLHEHDSRYVKQNKLNMELIGGVPVNEKNILLKDMDEKVIITNAGKLNYNMKWLAEQEGENKKSSFLRMVWIQACAELFMLGKCPSKIKWSYPGAMAYDREQSLQRIYNKCKQLPIEDKTVEIEAPMTESAAVCAYACSRGDEALQPYKIFLGIDIGGSTSDILILGKKEGEFYLFNQSSLRIAAGRFFEVILKSSEFKKALVKFQQSGESSVKVYNIDRIIKTEEDGKFAPYYLDSVFDQLKRDEFPIFYDEIRKWSPSAFALPAYITGVLCFYAGQLIASVIKNEKLTEIKEINFCYYGKGGRLFDWLFDVDKQLGKDFIKNCIVAGLNTSENGIKITIDVERSRENNKSEVAIGLISDKKIEGLQNRYDVIGERAFTDDKGEIDALEPITVEFYSHMSSDSVKIPDKFENFERFINLYLEFVGQTRIIKSDTVDMLREKICVVPSNFTATITSDPEYNIFVNSSAENKKGNLYRMPIFIASSIYYLEQILLPQVFK